MKNLIFLIIFSFAAIFATAQAAPAETSNVATGVKAETVTDKKAPGKVAMNTAQTPAVSKNEKAAQQTTQKKLDWRSLPQKLNNTMTIVAVVILLCACASKLSAWINMPCLLVFLGVGILCGEQGIGHIKFDNPIDANIIGSVAMAFILFSGGFDTNWKNIKGVCSTGGLLSSAGVLLTALSVAFVSFYFLKWASPMTEVRFSWCLLLGSIVSSTDAAAVFAILRSKNVGLRGQLRSLLEFESGSNDPMAAFLTIFMIGVVLAEVQSGVPADFSAYRMIVPSFIQKMLLGVVLGITWGKIMVWLFNKIDFEYDGLYYVLGIAAVILSYGGTELMQGNGFMSVYVTGLVMGNSKFIYRNGVGRFSDGIAWLMQVVLFGMLGLLVKPNLLLKIWWQGLTIAMILMLLARPISIFLCTIGSKFNLRERLLVSWVGLRGGAPIMLATFPLMADIPYNEIMFHIVFFIVLTSVILQGMTLMPVARLLKLDEPLRVCPRVPLEFDNTGTMDGDTREFEILPNSPLVGVPLSAAGLPKGALVLLIRRGKKHVVPHGDTIIEANDGLLILAENAILDETEQKLK
ncbi:MAG: potassium/proton antiporter [Lentisphaeria bacterium]|nr:potassium/proton antiporter [Lentisphaeria bacterium]